MCCLRSIPGVTRKDKLSNEEVSTKCNTSGIEYMLIKSQMRWVGHVIRMEDCRIPKSLIYGQFSGHTRKIGRPLLWFKDKIKANIKNLQLPNDWENLCLDRVTWRSTYHKSLGTFEKNRLAHKATLRQNRNSIPPISPQLQCPSCHFKARSNAGLATHKRFRHQIHK